MQTVVVNEIIIKRLSYNNEVIIFILGQNKNQYVVGYILRRVATNRHQEISHPHADTWTYQVSCGCRVWLFQKGVQVSSFASSLHRLTLIT